MIISFFASVQYVYSQKQVVEEITDGKEYWLGLPLCGREQNEAIRGDYPIAIWISSKVDTRARVEDQQTGSVINVVIRKNKITQVPFGDHLMAKNSEVAENKGIHVVGDDPISVAVYMSYKWSGEAYRVIPVEWLGRKYVTMNLYQDQLKQTGDYRPPQILVIATHDNTKLTYRPTTQTMKGVKAGGIGSANLRKGQTFLILGSIKPNLSQDNSTDLSGTYLQSNYPIAVISGHTKGAFPRYQFTFLGRNGGFMRNMMTDMVWPIELLGKEYISAPIQYADRKRNQIQDDRGDLIRFVATEDKTIIKQMRRDGTGFMQISPILKRGQFYDIVNQEEAAFYQANKKVLVAQYGKTWWNHAVHPTAKSGDDQPQNPSRNGQGMLIVLAPVDHWTSYATWKSPEQIDNFIYVTFDAKHLKYLYIDGVKFSVKFGNAVKYLEGTEYAYLAESISAGDHYMYGDTIPGTDGKEKATFGAYAYGNWDRSKDGFAYGYPIGINYNSPCEDSLVVTDTMICGDVTGKVLVLPENADCAWIYNILPEYLDNYDFSTDPDFVPGASKHAEFYLKIINPKKYAKGIVKIQTKSGKTQTITYEYWPEEIAFEPEKVDWGMLQEGDNICGKTFDIVNISKHVPVTVSDLYLKDSKPEFKINLNSTEHPVTLPFTLQPGERKTIEVCANAPVYKKETVRDFVIAELSCYEWPEVELTYTMGDPVVWIGDAKWENIPVGNLVSKEVKIINRSDVDVVLTKMTWPDADKTIFPKVEGLPCGPQGGDFSAPLTLKPYAEMTFTTYYHPDKVSTLDKTEALFVGNTTKDKLNSVWEGNSIDAGPGITGYDWQKKRIVDGKWVSNKYEGEIDIFCVGNTKINVDKVYIKDDTDGVFSIDSKLIPTQLQRDEHVKIPVYFEPQNELDYSAKVVFEAEFNSNVVTVEADLLGTGVQPHIEITGHTFGELYIDQSEKDYGKVEHNNPNPGYSMPLTVNQLRIVGPDANAFVIDRTVIDPELPKTLNPGQVWDIPITFTAKHPGRHVATLKATNWDEVNGNNPDQDAPEVAEGELIGFGYTEGLETTDWDYGTLFRSLSGDGTVILINTGTKTIEIQRNIDESVLGDINAFNLGMMDWRTSDGRTKNDLMAPFELDPNDTLFVDVRFTAIDVGAYSAQIEYKTDVGDAYSNLVGRGKIFRMVAEIPKDYESDPGGSTNITYFIRKATGETGTIEETQISEFKVFINFKDDSRGDAQDVYPDVVDCNDIETTGTLLDGWTCNYAKIIDDNTLQLYFGGDPNNVKILKGEGPLFRFNMKTYLSDLNEVPLPHWFEIIGTPHNYVLVDTIPGSIKITPVCVNTLRLIEISNVNYSLMQNQPNPASNNTKISYSVGLEARTTISLYNEKGDKVATLIDQNMKPGKYEITFNVNELGLGSGAYFYKMQSGPFTDTKTLIIHK
jgi:hypothetical protein